MAKDTGTWPSPEELAHFFHDTYERLAPRYDYETRPDSAKPWRDVPPKNRQLMVETARRVIQWLRTGP